MTAHISKEELGLMLPGTMNLYFADEPEMFRETTPGTSLLARIGAAISGWVSRQVVSDEIAGLTDTQLADIGISRAEATRAFDATFAADYNRDRLVSRIQTGRICTY